jgi:hypothetical protein
MHQQIICTFNCDVQGVDLALMRDGRLVIEHKFEKLNPPNARRICKQLEIPGNGDDIHQPITLAEIYARKNQTIKSTNNELQNGHTNKQKQTKRRSAFWTLFLITFSLFRNKYFCGNKIIRIQISISLINLFSDSFE